MKIKTLFFVSLLVSSFSLVAQSEGDIERAQKAAKKADKAFSKGAYKKSIDFYTKAISYVPNLEFNYYERGLVFKKMGRYEEALADFDKAIIINANSPHAYYERGLIHFEMKNYLKAIQDFDKQVLLNSDHIDCIRKKAAALVKLNRFDEAILVLDPVIFKYKNNSNDYVLRSLCYLNTGVLKESYSDMQAAIRLGDTTDERYRVESMLNMSLNKPKEAIQLLLKIVKTTPSVQNAHDQYLLSMAYMMTGNYTDAMARINIAISMNPLADYFYDKGCFAAENNDLELALECYTKTIELDPTYSAAYNNRTFYIWLPRKEFAKAIVDLSAVIALDSLDAYAYSNRSVAYFGLNQVEKGFLDAFKSIELEPRNPYPYKTLAFAYYEMKDEALAIEMAQEALSWSYPYKTDPEFVKLCELLKIELPKN
jgi:tetratricopeptide (TPR) repeat protein